MTLGTAIASAIAVGTAAAYVSQLRENGRLEEAAATLAERLEADDCSGHVRITNHRDGLMPDSRLAWVSSMEHGEQVCRPVEAHLVEEDGIRWVKMNRTGSSVLVSYPRHWEEQ